MASIAALALLALLAGSARSAVGQAGAGFGRSHPLIGSPRVRHSGGDAFGEVREQLIFHGSRFSCRPLCVVKYGSLASPVFPS